MNKLTRQITAISLSAALCLGSVCVAYAETTGKSDEAAPASTQSASTSSQTNTSESPQQAASKDETVYVLTDADGKVQKIIVSDWIKNTLKSGSLSDRSDLSDIENVKGNESYTLGSDNLKIWDAQGNDIYYQGSIEKELPVGLTVTYKLDGVPVSAEEISGKSGKVTIRFDYDNRQYETVTIDGRQERIYVPFAMLTGVMLDDDTFRNVEVSNGKLLNDGDHTIVVGLAFPGLQENLALDRDVLDIPNYVEITADAVNFEFGMTVTIATNGLFRDLDEEKINADDAASSVSALSDGMAQLMDGSSALYDGLCTLLEKSDELVQGIGQLAAGAKELSSGAGELDDGAASLQAGMEALRTGLDTLSSSSADLNNGAAQVFDSLLSTAAAQIRAAGIDVPDLTIETYSDVLTGLISALDESAVYDQAMQQVNDAVQSKRPEITALVTAAVQEEVTQQVTEAVRLQVSTSVTAAAKEQLRAQMLQSLPDMSETELEAAISQQMDSSAMQNTIEESITKQMESPEVQESISAHVDAQMQSEEIESLIAQNVEAQVQQAVSDSMNSEEVQSQLAAASEGAKSMIALKSSLDSYHTFYLGVCAYTSGVDTAASGAADLSSGAEELKNGTAQLKSGAETLYQGILTFQDGIPALTSGITQLRDGSMELSDGLKQFNEEGIQTLVTLVDGDLNSTLARLRATIEVSKAYQNFAGIEEQVDGQVKFIYRTDEISADQNNR